MELIWYLPHINVLQDASKCATSALKRRRLPIKHGSTSQNQTTVKGYFIGEQSRASYSGGLMRLAQVHNRYSSNSSASLYAFRGQKHMKTITENHSLLSGTRISLFQVFASIAICFKKNVKF